MILDQYINKRIEKKAKAKEVAKNDSHTKSIIKAISWRIVGTLDTIFISYFITGEIKAAITIGSVEVVTKMILYYFHERLWTKIKF